VQPLTVQDARRTLDIRFQGRSQQNYGIGRRSLAVNVPDRSSSGIPEHGILGCPPVILNGLPVEFRWEFTRRHPYYLLFWESAHEHWQNPSCDEARRKMGEAATLMLRLIGVTGDPPPLATKFGEMDETRLARAWSQGAIAPLSFRSLALTMLHGLPPDSRQVVADLLTRAPCDGDAEDAHGYSLATELMRLPDPSLDQLPNAPIIGINVDAPLRTIVKAVESWVQERKTLLGISEHRRRDDKLPEYLRVWDLREGWTDDHDDPRREKKLREIGDEVGEMVSTVVNRYRSAFKYLTGNEYTREIWFRLFGVFKTSVLTNPDVRARLTLRRPQRSPIPREVPESILAPQEQSDGHGGTFLENMAIVCDMQTSSDLLMDLDALIDRGFDDDRIASSLECPLADIQDELDQLRQRKAEGL
jgi:hypothetical protein